MTATECGRQRQLLLVTLLNFIRAVVQAAAICAYEYNPVDTDEDAENILKAAVEEATLLYQQQQQQIFAAGVKKGKQLRALQ